MAATSRPCCFLGGAGSLEAARRSAGEQGLLGSFSRCRLSAFEMRKCAFHGSFGIPRRRGLQRAWTPMGGGGEGINLLKAKAVVECGVLLFLTIHAYAVVVYFLNAPEYLIWINVYDTCRGKKELPC